MRPRFQADADFNHKIVLGLRGDNRQLISGAPAMAASLARLTLMC